ncbi:vitellogenin-1-like [Drosophila montana]|uniref:vitellogenin-1-like n=1 Tax=Drosophila montana TaxID=40370 RepID=UPI00313C6A22
MRSIFVWLGALSIFSIRSATPISSIDDNWAFSLKKLADGTVFDSIMNLAEKTVNTAYKYGSSVVEFTSDYLQNECIRMARLMAVPEHKSPDIRNMQFQFMTPCGSYKVPILEAETLWAHQKFQQNRKLVVLASGWLNTINYSQAIETIGRPFMCRRDINFVAVDVSRYVDTLYTWSALNTDIIGKHIAFGLAKLHDMMPLIDIHLIGHSLGAHIMGSAGLEFQRLTNRRVPRITGLDPAMPCFLKRSKFRSLSKGDAMLVDVIHTNPGFLGQRFPTGDIDFYPAGEDALKPGCLFIDCSHNRAFQYFAESVYPRRERSFLAYKCRTTKELETKACSSSTTTMGYKIDWAARGVYYVDVRSASPFGMKSATARTMDLMDDSDYSWKTLPTSE